MGIVMDLFIKKLNAHFFHRNVCSLHNGLFKTSKKTINFIKFSYKKKNYFKKVFTNPLLF